MQRIKRFKRAFSLKTNKLENQHRSIFLSLPDIREDVIETITASVSLSDVRLAESRERKRDIICVCKKINLHYYYEKKHEAAERKVMTLS